MSANPESHDSISSNLQPRTPNSFAAGKSSAPWNKDSIRCLRQRLGWSQAELSRRLKCKSSDVELWETGKATPSTKDSSEMFLLAQQAEACSQEVQSSPRAEIICDEKALGQIEYSEIKQDLE